MAISLMQISKSLIKIFFRFLNYFCISNKGVNMFAILWSDHKK
jgi:hypothetical protein